jgi:hypothetical protein
MEVSPSRRFEKTLVFPTCKHSRTLPIEHTVNSLRPRYDATYENQTFSHPIYNATCDLPFYRVFTKENATSFLRKSSSPFSLQELRPLTPLKETYRFTSLMVIGMTKIMCNNNVVTSGHQARTVALNYSLEAQEKNIKINKANSKWK